MNAIEVDEAKAQRIEDALMELALDELWEPHFVGGKWKLEKLDQVNAAVQQAVAGATPEEIEAVAVGSAYFPPAVEIAKFRAGTEEGPSLASEHDRVRQAALAFLRVRLGNVNEVGASLKEELLNRAKGIDPKFEEADLNEAITQMTGIKVTTMESLGLDSSTAPFIPEQQQLVVEELNRIGLKTGLKSTKETRVMVGIAFFNIFRKSKSYVNSKKMTDDGRKTHAVILRGLWDEIVNGGEAVARKDILETVQKAGVTVSSEANFFNYVAMVKLALTFFAGNEEATGKDALKQMKAGIPRANLLQKLYDDGFRTLEDLAKVPDVKLGEETPELAPTAPPARQPRGSKKVCPLQLLLEAQQAAKAEVAVRIAKLNEQVAELEAGNAEIDANIAAIERTLALSRQ